MPFEADHSLIQSLRFGESRLSYEELQIRADVVAHRQEINILRGMIDFELQNNSFYLFDRDESGALIRKHHQEPFEQLLSDLKTTIIERSSPGKRFWVTIEGIQGSGKSFLGEKLRDELVAAGKHVVLIQEDWYHKSRLEREKLKKDDLEAWKNHRQTWHHWDRYRSDWKRLIEQGVSGSEKFLLTDLYLPDDGLSNHQEAIDLYPDTVFICTGFYISDNEKFEFPQGEDRLKIYIVMTSEESLSSKLKRDFWRPEEDIRNLDREVYQPAFTSYTKIFRPDVDADYVLYYNIPDYSNVNVMKVGQTKDIETGMLIKKPEVIFKNQTVRIETEINLSSSYEVFAYFNNQEGGFQLRETQKIKKGLKNYVVSLLS